MAEPSRLGVFLCQGGHTLADSVDYLRLRWTAEAAEHAQVFEIAQACQDAGARALAGLAREHGLTAILLAACPLGDKAGPLGEALTEAGLDPGLLHTVDVCVRPEGERGPCRVTDQARPCLQQALAARRDLAAPVVEARRVSTSVMVLGEGWLALAAARSLARAGYGVTLLTPHKRLAPPEPLWGAAAAAQAAELAQEVESLPGVEVWPQAELLGLSGSAGAFKALVARRSGQVSRLDLGAVVVAQGPPLALNWPGDGLTEHSRVLGLGHLARLVEAPGHLAKLAGSQAPRVGLAVGLHRQAGPRELVAALEAGRAVIRELGGQAALFCSNLKVAAPGLEELSQVARAEGVLLFKLEPGELTVEASGSGLTLSCLDPILGRRISQEVDLLGVDEVPAPDAAYHRLARALGLRVARDGTLQPDRVGALSAGSGREGVLLVGEAAGARHPEAAQDGLGQALGRVRALLGRGEVEAPAGLVRVDRKRCTLCLTCIRVCPHGAMDRLERRPFANPLACHACGTCAAECPMDAIQVLGSEDARQRAQAQAGLTPAAPLALTPPPLEMLVLACANSAGAALRASRLAGRGSPEGVRLVELPCAGRIDPELVLGALRDGYDGVLILACHPGACHSLEGNTWAGYRLGELRRLLAEAGVEPDRLMSAGLAASQAREATAILARAWAELGALGPSPLKTGVQVREVLGRFTVGLDQSYTIQP